MIYRYHQLNSYLNLESTKTCRVVKFHDITLYSYLNLESTKTESDNIRRKDGCTVT